MRLSPRKSLDSETVVIAYEFTVSRLQKQTDFEILTAAMMTDGEGREIGARIQCSYLS